MELFSSVADLALADLVEGQFVETIGYYGRGTDGGAKYLIMTEAEAAIDGNRIDGKVNHEIANGNVAILNEPSPLPSQYGAYTDSTNPTITSSALQAWFDDLGCDDGD